MKGAPAVVHHCAVCGRALKPRKKGPGRPALYCDSVCAGFAFALAVIERDAGKIHKRADAENWARLRGDLWRSGNQHAVRPKAGGVAGPPATTG